MNIKTRLSKIDLRIFIDLQLIFLAYYTSFLLRFDFQIPSNFLKIFLLTLPVVVIVKVINYALFHVYQILWRYVGINDLIKLVYTSTLNNIIYGLAIYFLFQFQGYPRAVIIIDYFLFITFLGGIRFLYRYRFTQRNKSKNFKRVLIIGAGDAAEAVVREMVANKIGYFPVGLLDDDSKKCNKIIHGVRVLGPIKNMYEIALKLKVEEIIIAIPSASYHEMQKIIEVCESCHHLNIKYKTVPGLNEILSGHKSPTAIRDIRLEDLIGRELVHVDQMNIREKIKGKIIMITGAAGSIGSELARQIYNYQPQLLICVDRNENDLLYLEKELDNIIPSQVYNSIVADISHKRKMEQIISNYKPSYIYHAAAYKHVPYMEENPHEAVINNVYATYNLAKLAEKYKVTKFVFISTDKAVNPTSVMGCSKRIAELVLLNLFESSTTKFVVVRFGNVIGSAGSVVEIFKKQIKTGGPLTVTHPQIKRYFMTIPEAVRLTLHAGNIGHNKEILILDMGEQIPILKIAENLIKLAGLKPYEDIEIKFVGIRPGEKMLEELWGEKEILVPTDHPKINKTYYNDYSDNFDFNLLEKLIKISFEHNNALEIKKLMKALIPDYQLTFTFENSKITTNNRL